MVEHALTADDIVTLRAIMPDDRFVIVNDRDMPDVCLQHLLALTLVDGDLTFASSHDHARMKDPAVLDVRRRIEAIPSAELTAARPARPANSEQHRRATCGEIVGQSVSVSVGAVALTKK